jgi:hypothetical protein
MATDFFDPVYMDNVFDALLAQVKTATFPPGTLIKSYSRVFLAPDEVPVESQPALYMVPGPQHVDQKEFALAKWTFTAILIIYMRADADPISPNPLPARIANYIIWGIMNSLLAPLPGIYEKQTLGGLVTHCWIEGEVRIEVQAEQVVIAIPVYILAGNIS